MQVTTWATLSKYTIDSIMIWHQRDQESGEEGSDGALWEETHLSSSDSYLGSDVEGGDSRPPNPTHCYTGTQVTLPLPSHPGLGYVPFLFAGGVQGSSQPLYGPAALAVYVTHSLDWLHPASPVGQPQSPGSIGPALTPAPPPSASPPPTVFPTLS